MSEKPEQTDSTVNESWEVTVRPVRGREEAIGVAAIIALIILLMVVRFYWVATAEGEIYLRPFQRLDDELKGKHRAVYQALSAAVPEILSLRDQEGIWPEAELLDMDFIPPFNAKLMPESLRGYTWQAIDNNAWVDYIGSYNGDEPISLILRIIDLQSSYHPHPHPGIEYDPNEKAAVQIWMIRKGDAEYPGQRVIEKGWVWLVGPDDETLKQKPKFQSTPPPMDQDVSLKNAAKQKEKPNAEPYQESPIKMQTDMLKQGASDTTKGDQP